MYLHEGEDGALWTLDLGRCSTDEDRKIGWAQPLAQKGPHGSFAHFLNNTSISFIFVYLALEREAVLLANARLQYPSSIGPQHGKRCHTSEKPDLILSRGKRCSSNHKHRGCVFNVSCSNSRMRVDLRAESWKRLAFCKAEGNT